MNNTLRTTNKHVVTQVWGLAVSATLGIAILFGLAASTGSFQDRTHTTSAPPRVVVTKAARASLAARLGTTATTYYLVDTQAEADALRTKLGADGANSVIAVNGSPDADVIIESASAGWGENSVHLVDLRGTQ